MTTASAYTLIRAFLEENWTATTLAWPNETFVKPGPAAAWVAVMMRGGVWDQESIGAGERLDNRWQEEGDLLLGVAVPLGTGSLVAREHATALANLFRGLQLEDIEFRAIHIDDGADAEDRGPWWLLPVRVNWLKG
jgi:hypothetical protein